MLPQGVWDRDSPLENAREMVSAAVEASETCKKQKLDGSRQKIRGVAKRRNWVHIAKKELVKTRECGSGESSLFVLSVKHVGLG